MALETEYGTTAKDHNPDMFVISDDEAQPPDCSAIVAMQSEEDATHHEMAITVYPVVDPMITEYREQGVGLRPSPKDEEEGCC